MTQNKQAETSERKDYREAAEKLSQKLSALGYVPYYAPTAADALAKVIELIPEGASVGVPGTLTIRQMGAIDKLKELGHTVVEHWAADQTAADKLEARYGEAQCDVFLTSSNAITEDGELVNIDGSGNRLAAMCWSRGDRIYVISMNKLCADIPAALKRIYDKVAPTNAERLGISNARSICRATLILNAAPTMPAGKKACVILTGEPLGY